MMRPAVSGFERWEGGEKMRGGGEGETVTVGDEAEMAMAMAESGRKAGRWRRRRWTVGGQWAGRRQTERQRDRETGSGRAAPTADPRRG